MYQAITKLTTAAERDAIDQLFRECAPKMLRVVISQGFSKSEAEDIVIDAMLSLFDKGLMLLKWDERARHAYLLKTVSRQAIRHAMKHKAYRARIFTGGDAETTSPDFRFEPSELLCQEQLRQGILQALSQLSDRDRLLLYCRYIDDLSTAEIAQLLKISAYNVGKYLYIARKRAAPLLKEAIANEI